jgi:hypothetical protein
MYNVTIWIGTYCRQIYTTNIMWMLVHYCCYQCCRAGAGAKTFCQSQSRSRYEVSAPAPALGQNKLSPIKTSFIKMSSNQLAPEIRILSESQENPTFPVKSHVNRYLKAVNRAGAKTWSWSWSRNK